MFKQLMTAAAALAVTLPVNAASIHDFTPGRDYGTPAARPTLDSQCYKSKAGDYVCFFRIRGEVYSVSILDISESLYPQAMVIDCDGRYETYGELSSTKAELWAQTFCEDGRY